MEMVSDVEETLVICFAFYFSTGASHRVSVLRPIGSIEAKATMLKLWQLT
jgi:hypothetical protein